MAAVDSRPRLHKPREQTKLTLCELQVNRRAGDVVGSVRRNKILEEYGTYCVLCSLQLFLKTTMVVLRAVFENTVAHLLLVRFFGSCYGTMRSVCC